MNSDAIPTWRARRWESRLHLAVLLAAVLAIGAGCKKKRNQAPPEEEGSIHRDAGVSGPSDPRYGSQGAVTVDRPTQASNGGGGASGSTSKRTYKNCRKPVPVTKADPSTPEGTLYMVFEALLMKDDDAAFSKFYSLIDSDFQNERDARRYWFASARKNDKKAFLRLVYSAENPSFDICSQRPEGKTAVRIFVGKSPPVGSNPPYVLNKKGDKWLLKSFTPH